MPTGTTECTGFHEVPAVQTCLGSAWGKHRPPQRRCAEDLCMSSTLDHPDACREDGTEATEVVTESSQPESKCWKAVKVAQCCKACEKDCVSDSLFLPSTSQTSSTAVVVAKRLGLHSNILHRPSRSSGDPGVMSRCTCAVKPAADVDHASSCRQKLCV